MMRTAVLALALLCAGCASAPERSESAVEVVAEVMVGALAAEGHASADFDWGAFYTRVPRVNWHGQGVEPAGDEPGSGVRRVGWLASGGWQFEVVTLGSEARVRSFGIDVNDTIETEALLEALRAEGAVISFEGDDESAMFYAVAVPGRELAQLEARRICTPYGSRAARHCRSVMTLNFELL